MLKAPSPVRTAALCWWHDCRGCDSTSTPRDVAGDVSGALLWLRSFKPDTMAMLALRRLALDAGGDMALSRFDDEAVLAQLAGWIASGKLRVCGQPLQAKKRSGSGAASDAPTPPGPVPPPPRPRPPRPRPEVVVTVVIQPSQPVACPGHPLPITAVGTPGGGTFAWTFSGGTNARLVDGALANISRGPNVNLLGFKPNDADGSIPAQPVSLTVTYTHPNGTATDTKTVPIHKIEFEVTDTTIAAGVTQVTETATQVRYGPASPVPTMSTNPKVKIKLDAACPRKAACAGNHRVGWLQTVLTSDRRATYTNTLVRVVVPLPIRDALNGAPVFPFYGPVSTFTGDNDTQTAHHEDSPGGGFTWVDGRAAAPQPPPATNAQLRSVSSTDSFTAWLPVQNIEWAAHDLPGSFAYQRHFDWSDSLIFAVDTSVAPALGGGASRCNPGSNPPTIGAVVAGKGSNPNLAAPTANGSATRTSTPIP